MLARSPSAMTWVDESTRFSRLYENGTLLAVIDMAYGHWEYRLEQSVIPHRAKSSRTMRNGYGSKIACQIAAEDHIHGIRSPSEVSPEIAVMAREAMAAPDHADEHRLVAWDVLNSVGTWR
jgi:hypothetical protein